MRPGVFAALALESSERAVRVLAATILLAEVPELKFVRTLLEASKDKAILVLALSALLPNSCDGVQEIVERLALEHSGDADLFDAAMRILVVLNPDRATEIILELLENGTDREVKARAAAFLRAANRPDIVTRLVRAWAVGVRASKNGIISGEDPFLKAVAKLDPEFLELIAIEVLTLQLDPTETNLFIYGMRGAAPEFASTFFARILEGDYPTIHKRQAVFALAYVNDSTVIEQFVQRLISTSAEDPLRSDLLSAASLLNPALLKATTLSDLREACLDPAVRSCLSVLIARSDLVGLTGAAIESIRKDLESDVVGGTVMQSVTAADGFAAIARREADGASTIASCLDRLPNDHPAVERLVRGASSCELSPDLLRVMKQIGTGSSTKPALRLDAVRYVLKVGDLDSQAAVLPEVVKLLRDKKLGLRSALMVGESCTPEMLARIRDSLSASGGADHSLKQVVSLLEDFLEAHSEPKEGGK